MGCKNIWILSLLMVCGKKKKSKIGVRVNVLNLSFILLKTVTAGHIVLIMVIMVG